MFCFCILVFGIILFLVCVGLICLRIRLGIVFRKCFVWYGWKNLCVVNYIRFLVVSVSVLCWYGYWLKCLSFCCLMNYWVCWIKNCGMKYSLNWWIFRKRLVLFLLLWFMIKKRLWLLFYVLWWWIMGWLSRLIFYLVFMKICRVFMWLILLVMWIFLRVKLLNFLMVIRCIWVKVLCFFLLKLIKCWMMGNRYLLWFVWKKLLLVWFLMKFVWIMFRVKLRILFILVIFWFIMCVCFLDSWLVYWWLMYGDWYGVDIYGKIRFGCFGLILLVLFWWSKLWCWFEDILWLGCFICGFWFFLWFFFWLCLKFYCLILYW